MVASRARTGQRGDFVVTGGPPPVLAVAYAALSLVLALFIAACGGSSAAGPSSTPARPADGELTVRAVEWGYEPEAIAVRQGEQVRIVFENDGLILHNLKVDDLAAEVIEARSTGPISGGDGQLFVGAEVGQRGTLVFVPLESGTFTVYCTIPQHRQLGMEGILTVE